MAINKDTVKCVAELARIKLDGIALDNMTSQLDKILNYIEKLNQINTENTTPTSHVLALKDVFRKDEHKPSLSSDEALKNAPEKENGYFKVPKII